MYCFDTLTVPVFSADLRDDLNIFLHLPLEAFLPDTSAVESNDQRAQLLYVRDTPPASQHV